VIREQFLDTLPDERKEILSGLRDLILMHDKDVKEVVGDMMGKPSLIYVTKKDWLMKYSLSLAKNHMSFASMRVRHASAVPDYAKLMRNSCPKQNSRRDVLTSSPPTNSRSM